MRKVSSKELETLFLTIQGELYMRTATNTDNSGLIQFVDKLYLLLESYESTPELCTKYEEYYSLFPKEKFDTEIQSIRKHVIELQKLCQDSENTLETLNDIVLLIDEYPKKADDEIYIVSDALLEILSNNNDRWNFKEYKFFQKYLIEAVKLKIFLRDLKLHSPFLKDQALIYSDIMLDSMKINWIGVQEDCAKLIKFLVDHKFIEKKQGGINQFIVKHFKFKGENKNNREYGRKNSSCGSIIVMGNDLKISK